MPIDPRHPASNLGSSAGYAARIADLERQVRAAQQDVGRQNTVIANSFFKLSGQDRGELGPDSGAEYTEPHGLNISGSYLVIASLVDRFDVDPNFFSSNAHVCTWALRTYGKTPNSFRWAIYRPATPTGNIAFRLDYIIVPL